jgi:alpha-galactosidase
MIMSTGLRPVAENSSLLEMVFDHEQISAAVPLGIGVSGKSVDLSGEFTMNLVADGLTGTAQVHGLLVDWHAQTLGSYPVWNFGFSVNNLTDQSINLTRLDSSALALKGGVWRVESFSSAWGDEFRMQNGTTLHDSFFGVRSGRSSHGGSPVVYFTRESDGFTVIVSPAWSGNWHLEALAGGLVSAGISTWNLNIPLRPNETINAPSVIVSAGENQDAAQNNLQLAIRDYWLARTPATDAVPVEWNHWWPYEDVEINEDVIRNNVELAKDMDIDTIVVDAGWFGESKLDTNWTDLRGDWDSINLARFPNGLSQLGESISKEGLAPGIWIELEAVGAKSKLRETMPEAMARDDSGLRPDTSFRVATASLDPEDPGFIGYICLGSNAGWSHAYNSVKNVVGEMKARWLKMDFNVDPGFGCTRTDHGHSAGDGLLRHYEGLYKLLDQIRLDFPELLIEACSSGGLRIDLGLARHVHCFFLSDPDYTEHHLQVLWGAARMLPPLAILHWPWSWWRGDYEPSKLDWSKLEVESFDVMMRSAMVHRLGISYPLPKLPERLRQRLGHHLRVYKTHIAPIIASATLTPLTESSLRGNRGERNPAWQLTSHKDGGQEVHLVMSVKLEKDAKSSTFRPAHLSADKHYIVTDLETTASASFLGKEITAQTLARLAGEASSWILEIRPKEAAN